MFLTTYFNDSYFVLKLNMKVSENSKYLKSYDVSYFYNEKCT